MKFKELLKERMLVVDALMKNAIVTAPEEDSDVWSVTVPGAIREKNTVKAESEEEAIEKVRQVLHVKEQSKLESLKRIEESGSEKEATDLEVQNGKIEQGSEVANG